MVPDKNEDSDEFFRLISAGILGAVTAVKVYRGDPNKVLGVLDDPKSNEVTVHVAYNRDLTVKVMSPKRSGLEITVSPVNTEKDATRETGKDFPYNLKRLVFYSEGKAIFTYPLHKHSHS